jgi:enoyl-CoA hydratase
MDLILTGRAVDADEALSIGLANRAVPAGEARAAAEELARQLTAFPQECLRGDRRSVLAQEGMDEQDAMRAEFAIAMGEHGLTQEALRGAGRFAGGAGRHGSFDA